jgi:TonB family protein
MPQESLWFHNLAAYSLQVAVIVVVGSLLLSLFRLDLPKIRLGCWQALLGGSILLPLIQPWRSEWASEGPGAISRITMAGPFSPSAAWSISSAALGLLLGGILLRLIWTALGLTRVRAYRKQACPLLRESRSIREARALTGARARVYLCASLQSPATVGARAPAILLPRRFLELPAPQQKAIACHEFLHAARRDWVWAVAEELVLTVLWFHPAVWWIVKNIRLSREQAVDAEVIRLTSSRRAYLDALVTMAQRRVESVPAALFLTESQLAQRMALILKEVKMSRLKLVTSLFSAATILLVAGTAAVWSFPLSAPASAPALVSPGPDNVFRFEGKDYQTGGKIYKVGKNVSPPVPIHDSQPLYTRQARKAKLHGTAVFSVVVDAKGDVDGVKEISKPLGLGLDQSAIKALRTWKFKPALRDGAPVPVRVDIEVTFRLN